MLASEDDKKTRYEWNFCTSSLLYTNEAPGNKEHNVGDVPLLSDEEAGD